MTGTDDGDKRRPGLLGPLAIFPCAVSAGDKVGVRRTGAPKTLGARVAIGVKELGRTSSAVLTPENARRLAAAILNAADEADGTTPIRYFPPSPDGVQPGEA